MVHIDGGREWNDKWAVIRLHMESNMSNYQIQYSNKPHLYHIFSMIDGMQYRGRHNGTIKNYVCGSKKLRRDIEKYGLHNYIRFVTKEFDNIGDEIEAEREYVNEEWVTRKDTYNVIIGGLGGCNNDAILKVIATMERRSKYIIKSPHGEFPTTSSLARHLNMSRDTIRKRLENQRQAWKDWKIIDKNTGNTLFPTMTKKQEDKILSGQGQNQPVITPYGEFDSIKATATHFKKDRSTIKSRIDSDFPQWKGWRYK